MCGYVLKLRRQVGSVFWVEDITVTSIRSYDEESGILKLFALTGRSHKKLDPSRECGQSRTIHINEILKSKQGGRMSTATKAPKKTTAPKAKKAATPKAPKRADEGQGTKTAAPLPSHQPNAALTATVKSEVVKAERFAKRIEALAMREAGKKFQEIADHFGWANSGVANNAVRRAKAARDGNVPEKV
jgi:hypothetical protein